MQLHVSESHPFVGVPNAACLFTFDAIQEPLPLSALQGGLPAFAPDPAQASYRYVVFDIWFITVTRRSVALGIKAAALTFTALQVVVLLMSTCKDAHPNKSIAHISQLHNSVALGVKAAALTFTALQVDDLLPCSLHPVELLGHHSLLQFRCRTQVQAESTASSPLWFCPQHLMMLMFFGATQSATLSTLVLTSTPAEGAGGGGTP